MMVRLRAWLEAQERSYVLAVSCDHRLWVEGRQERVDVLSGGAARRGLDTALLWGGQPGAAALRLGLLAPARRRRALSARSGCWCGAA